MDNKAILILTNSDDATSDYLESYLNSAIPRILRFDTDTDLASTSFVFSRNEQYVSWRTHLLRPDEISAVIFRRPKPFAPPVSDDPYHVEHAANEWAEAWEGFLAQVPLCKWINHPSRNFGASHKIHQLIKASSSGLRVPETLVTNAPPEALAFFDRQINGVVVKPLASGFIERSDTEDDTIIYANILEKRQMQLIHQIKSCPVLFQERIKKKIDVRVTVLDQEMVAIGLIETTTEGTQRLDIRRDNMVGVQYLLVDLPNSVRASISAMMQAYELRFAAIDFAVDEAGDWVFFEINPNGQWAWFDLEGVSSIAELFVHALRSQ